MISQTNTSALRSAYTSNLTESKTSRNSGATTVSKQGDLSKVEQLKESIASGEYKVDLEALSQKIAQELL